MFTNRMDFSAMREPLRSKVLRVLCALTALLMTAALFPALGTDALAADTLTANALTTDFMTEDALPSSSDSVSYTPLYHDHTLYLSKAKAAGCTEDGRAEYYLCPDCGRLFADRDGAKELSLSDVVIPAAGHIIVYVSPSDAACAADGAKEHYACSVCGALFSDRDGAKAVSESDVVIPALGHKPSHVSPTDAACETDGAKEHYICPVCGELFADSEGSKAVSASDVIIPAHGHTVTYVAEVDAACETDGAKEHYECVICGKIFSDKEGTKAVSASDISIPAKGHKLGYIKAVAAQCEKAGSIEHYKCEVCGKLFKDKDAKTSVSEQDITVKALGHKWDGGKVTKRATYRAEGTRLYTCKNDSSHTKTETISKLKENKNYGFTASSYSWTKRSEKNLSLIVKNSDSDTDTYDNFDEIEVDGSVLGSKYYTVAKGSLKVSLKSSYLETLSKGKHTMTVYFIDGKASASITVNSSGSGSNPSTGDGAGYAGLIAAMSFFTFSLGYVSYCLCGQMDGRMTLFAGGARDFFDGILPFTGVQEGGRSFTADGVKRGFGQISACFRTLMAKASHIFHVFEKHEK